VGKLILKYVRRLETVFKKKKDNDVPVPMPKTETIEGGDIEIPRPKVKVPPKEPEKPAEQVYYEQIVNLPVNAQLGEIATLLYLLLQEARK
jgi:hypothetical protein